MQSDSPKSHSQRGENFVEALSDYSRFHRAQHWSGTFGEFLRTIVAAGNVPKLARTSHEFLWDMLNWYGHNAQATSATATAANTHSETGKDNSKDIGKELFKR